MILGPVMLGLSGHLRATGVTHAQLAEHSHCEQLLIGSPVNGGNELRNTGFGVLNLDQIQAADGHCSTFPSLPSAEYGPDRASGGVMTLWLRPTRRDFGSRQPVAPELRLHPDNALWTSWS